jgi:hypothetical protein
MATGKQRTSSGVRVLVAQAALVVRVVPAELAVRVALAAQVASAELAVQAAQEALAELAVQEAQAELVVRVAPAEPELDLAVAERELVQGAVGPEHDRVVVPVRGHRHAQLAVPLRTRSVTGVHHPGLAPVLAAAASVAVAETTREPAAPEAVRVWAAAVTAVAAAGIAVAVAADAAAVE